MRGNCTVTDTETTKVFRITCYHCKAVTMAAEVVPLAHYRCGKCKNVINVTNIPIQEWLGFNFGKYLANIKAFIKKDPFENLKAVNAAEVAAGKLSQKQIGTLKTVLVKNFDQGGTIKDISTDIRNQVKIKDLKVYNQDGDLYMVIPKEARSINIARTETTRVANEGARESYAQGGIQEIAWIATLSERTCADCEELNGQVFPINTSNLPPLHALCRCTTQAVMPK